MISVASNWVKCPNITVLLEVKKNVMSTYTWIADQPGIFIYLLSVIGLEGSTLPMMYHPVVKSLPKLL